MSEKEDKVDWVDFGEVKAKVSMEMVLGHYDLLEGLRQSGKNLVGCCPIHKGSNPRQFSVSPEKNVFNCFGDCNGGGNVLDFVAKMEGVSVRQAGLMLKDWFGEVLELGKPEPAKEEKEEQGEVVNPPLTFELKRLEQAHPFFEEQGIERATIEHFGLGFCSRGLMKGRIAIPICDERGRLVAYCGRAVSEEQTKREGRYKMPADFVKSAVVYNLHRQKGQDWLVLVEDFESVWWLYQAGVSNGVALMDSQLGVEQEKLIVDWLGSRGRVALMCSNDERGQACENDCLAWLSRRLFVKVVDISGYGLKPYQVEQGIIKNLL